MGVVKYLYGQKQTTKYWSIFKTHFAEAHKYYHMINAASAASNINISSQDSPSHDNNSGPLFTNAVIPDSPLTTIARHLSSISSRVRNFTQAPSSTSIPSTTSTLSPTPNSSRLYRETREYNNNNYWWSHGFDIHPKHTSTSCENRKEGHQSNATRNNTMNGKMWYKHLVFPYETTTSTTTTNTTPPITWLSLPSHLLSSPLYHFNYNNTSFPQTPFFIVDSGWSHHFLPKNFVTTYIHSTPSPITIHLPNNTTMITSKYTTLPFPQLPTSASHSYICPHLTQYGLLSIPQLTKYGCTATFTQHTVTLTYNNYTLFCSQSHTHSNLYIVSYSNLFPNTHHHQYLNHTSPLPPQMTTQHLLAFYHRVIFLHVNPLYYKNHATIFSSLSLD